MSKKLLFATGNENKVRELEALLAAEDLSIDVLSLTAFPDYTPPPEDGATFRENARIKARFAAEMSGMPALADDSGLCVAALNGAPGVFSARYAGENATAEAHNEKLLAALADVAPGQRDAYFAAVFCLAFPGGEEIYSEGRVEGEILTSPRGSDGFGYDPIFFVTEKGKGMAEMTLREKNFISHRSRAFQGIITALSSL